MKYSHIKGIAVVDLQDARNLGTLEDLMLDPNNRQVVGLKVKTGLFGSHILIPLNCMRSIGKDAITITYDNGSPVEAAENGMPQADKAAAMPTVPDAPTLSGLSQILENQVVTDSGTLLGQIKDVLLNDSDLSIEGYEVSMSGLFSQTQMFPASVDVRYGGKLVTVPQELFEKKEAKTP